MLFLPEASGPSDPVLTTVLRRPGSVRRTSSIDTTRPDGLAGDSVVTARARDLRTGADLATGVLGAVDIAARIDRSTGQLVELAVTPPVPGLDQLLGCLVGPGFRSQVNRVCPREQEAGTLLHLLLDDLPGATLVSGYALQRAGAFRRPRPSETVGQDLTGAARMMAAQDDLCAGWAHDGTMMVTIRSTGEIPVPTGPPAPLLERADDPLAWHAMEPLPPHGMRRRRRLDVVGPDVPGGEDGPYRIDAHFRDSHVDEAGAESVVHEYSVSGTVEGARVRDIGARANVLPWVECPGALASAERLSGMAVAELRNHVRREFKGTSTCTHLNDTLRSLGDVDVLVAGLSTDGRSGRGVD